MGLKVLYDSTGLYRLGRPLHGVERRLTVTWQHEVECITNDYSHHAPLCDGQKELILKVGIDGGLTDMTPRNLGILTEFLLETNGPRC